MPKLSLEPGEHIIDKNFKKHGAIPAFLFQVLIPVGIIITLFLVLKYALPALKSISANPVTKDIKVYGIIQYAYIPLMVLVVAACVYYFASLFMERLVLTNKAIIQTGVFNNNRIVYATIKNIELKKGSFNSINEQKQWAWFIKNLLCIDNIVEIETNDDKQITLTDLNHINALRLREKIISNLPVGTPNV